MFSLEFIPTILIFLFLVPLFVATSPPSMNPNAAANSFVCRSPLLISRTGRTLHLQVGKLLPAICTHAHMCACLDAQGSRRGAACLVAFVHVQVGVLAACGSGERLAWLMLTRTNRECASAANLSGQNMSAGVPRPKLCLHARIRHARADRMPSRMRTCSRASRPGSKMRSFLLLLLVSCLLR